MCASAFAHRCANRIKGDMAAVSRPRYICRTIQARARPDTLYYSFNLCISRMRDRNISSASTATAGSDASVTSRSMESRAPSDGFEPSSLTREGCVGSWELIEDEQKSSHVGDGWVDLGTKLTEADCKAHEYMDQYDRDMTQRAIERYALSSKRSAGDEDRTTDQDAGRQETRTTSWAT